MRLGAGYGEAPHVHEAMRIAAEDYLAGGRDYYVVYGNVETHFLTGDPTPDSQLDAWVRQGGKFTATTSGDRFAFELDGLEQLQVPQAIHNRAQAGETIEFTDDRGVKFEVSPSRFPNGEMGSSTRVIYSPIDNADVWMWYATRTGSGSTLDEAIKASFEAEPVARKRK